MATTEAQVCNIALARVGHRDFIDDLTDETTAAQVCDAHFDDARDAVLASVHWKFATRRATLAVISGAERSGWGYVYALPTDCIAPRSLYPGTRIPAAAQRIPFELEDDATYGTVLMTDLADAELIYTHRHSTVVRWPPLFVHAVAWRLAMELALALPVKPAVGMAMEKGYRAALAEALAVELNSVREDPEPDSPLISVR